MDFVYKYEKNMNAECGKETHLTVKMDRSRRRGIMKRSVIEFAVASRKNAMVGNLAGKNVRKC